MTDPDRLAALLLQYHSEWYDYEGDVTWDQFMARNLIAAGVTLLDVERLAKALARLPDHTDAWVLLPKQMQDLWRKGAAAIAREYTALEATDD